MASTERVPEIPALSNRRRLLAVMDILNSKTDEEHGLSLSEIIAELKVYFHHSDFHVTLPALKEDIYTLQDSGIGIEEIKKLGAATKYKWSSRKFDVYELRILIDAVASARSLTLKDSELLIEKIKSLTSENQAKRLGSRLYVEDHVKATSSVVKFYIGDIHEAILNRQKITFQYRKYNTQKRFELHRNGFVYTVKPYALVWSQDKYYLIAYQEGLNVLKTFRIDRLYAVTLANEHFADTQFYVSRYVNNMFNMYPGDLQTVRIRFHNSLINVVIDRFGEQVSLFTEDETSFVIVIQAAISEGLKRWILTWGADAQVLSPPELVNVIGIEAEKMVSMYKKG